ncbi:unnamed protein product, partial [Chrysoparadoxa australica]
PCLQDFGLDELAEPLVFSADQVMKLKGWIASFEKPNTSPNSLQPSTTVLSPYMSFGCASPCCFYHKIAEVYSSSSHHSQPPVSLHGQLLWRDFFTYVGKHTVNNFNKMKGNELCRQIPWEKDDAKLLAWKEGRTGFPFVAAMMTQLRKEGWIHHLARHMVACFLTRGDLWQSWEAGAKVRHSIIQSFNHSIIQSFN